MKWSYLVLLLLFMGLGAARAQVSSMPDFELKDFNPSSPRNGRLVSPRDYLLHISAYYFASTGCGYCRSQYGHLQTVLNEVMRATPGWRVEVVAVNRIGEEANNHHINDYPNVIPWVQDTTNQLVWERWGVQWRDLIILDCFNRPVARDNLTTHDM
jgi:hypothetical protein